MTRRDAPDGRVTAAQDKGNRDEQAYGAVAVRQAGPDRQPLLAAGRPRRPVARAARRHPRLGGRAVGRQGGRGRDRRARRLRGVLRLSRRAAALDAAPADRDRRRRGGREPVAADLRRDPDPGLQARHRRLGGRRAARRGAARAQPHDDAAPAGASALFRDARRLARRRRPRAAAGGRAAPPAPGGGRLRLRGGAGRQLRGRGLRHPAQPGHRLRDDLRGLRLRLAPRRAGAAQRAGRGRLRRRPRRRRRHGAGPRLRPEAAAAGPRRLPSLRPPRRTHRRRPARRRNPPRALLGRGAPGAAPLGPRRRRRPLPHALLRQPEEVCDAADQHLPRAADRPRQVGVQVRLDPRHGRILRPEHLPGGIERHDGRPRQPAGADRQHQGSPGDGGARLRRRPRLLRHQRHQHLEQDGAPGADRARRHRAARPQLPQVAPLRPGAGRRPAALHRRLPDDGILDVRRGAARQHQEGAPRPQGRGAARPGEDGRPHQLHLRRPHLQHPPGDGGMPRHQAGPDLPLGRGLVRLRPLVAVPPPAHRDGRRRGDREVDRRPGVGRGLGAPAGRARRRSVAGDAPRHAADPGPAQGAAAGLPDQLDAQVDVGAAPGLDAPGQGHRLPRRRGAVPRGGLHPRLDLAQPAADRQPRRGAPADGARRLRPRRQRHRDRAGHPPRGERPPADLEVLQGPRRRRDGAGGSTARAASPTSWPPASPSRTRSAACTRTSSASTPPA